MPEPAPEIARVPVVGRRNEWMGFLVLSEQLSGNGLNEIEERSSRG